MTTATSTATQPAKTPADLDLQRRVSLFIQQRQLAKGAQLSIYARQGVVTLVGLVPTFHQRQLLHSLTRNVAGVIRVQDELEVHADILSPRLDHSGSSLPAAGPC